MAAPLVAPALGAVAGEAGGAAGGSSLASKMPKGFGIDSALGVVELADALIPGKHEKRMRREHEALNQQVKSGHGMSKGQRQGYLATMAQQRNAQLQQMKPQINRGFAGDSGQSGIVHSANQGMMRSAMDSARGDASQVAQLDLAMLEQKRAQRDGQRAEIMALNAANTQRAMAAGKTIATGLPGKDEGIEDRANKANVADTEAAGLTPVGR